MSEIKKIKVAGREYGIADETNRTELQNLKNSVNASISWQGQDLNNYTTEGIYLLKGTRTSGDNVPIINEGTITARLSVLVTENSGNKVVTQVLTLNNNTGGEGNVYVRSQQAGTWKLWGKLQTNVEVGQITPDDMNNLTDNGIYSGVCVDGATVETFVLIVINNYLAASQDGLGSYISQLKYAIDLNKGNTVKTRTRDAYGIWDAWSSIGDKYELPVATANILGGVKLGKDGVLKNHLCPVGVDENNALHIAIGTEFSVNSGGFLKLNLGTGLIAKENKDHLTTTIHVSTADEMNIGGVMLGTKPYDNKIIKDSNDLVPVTLDSAAMMCFGVGGGLSGSSGGLLQLKLKPLRGLLVESDGIGVSLGSGFEFTPYGAGSVELVKRAVFNRQEAFLPLSLRENDVKSGGEMGIGLDENLFYESKDGVLSLIGGIAPTKVTWGSSSNMNDYITAGIYDIYGERTNAADNLPITQAYNGASIAARLTVVASTLQPNNTEKCITQFLQLSNRMGGDGNTYIRTYNENNNGLNGWTPWKKQQGMVESYINTDTVGITATGGQTTGLNGMTENGIYSGIYTDYNYVSGLSSTPSFMETFVLIVINDYAVSSQAGTPRRISQLKYATDTLTGQCTVKKRVFGGGDPILDAGAWSDWEEIGGGSSSNYLGTQTLSTIRENNTIKSGTYYGILSDKDNQPFILEVSTNFDDGGVDDKDKVGIMKLTIATASNYPIECCSEGYYSSAKFKYDDFNYTRVNNEVVVNNLVPIRTRSHRSTIRIDKFDDSLTLPSTKLEGKLLYEYILNTANTLSATNVVIELSPSLSYHRGFLSMMSTQVDVIYHTYSSPESIPIRYDKLIVNASGSVYKIYSTTDMEEITV